MKGSLLPTTYVHFTRLQPIILVKESESSHNLLVCLDGFFEDFFTYGKLILVSMTKVTTLNTNHNGVSP